MLRMHAAACSPPSLPSNWWPRWRPRRPRARRTRSVPGSTSAWCSTGAARRSCCSAARTRRGSLARRGDGGDRTGDRESRSRAVAPLLHGDGVRPRAARPCCSAGTTRPARERPGPGAGPTGGTASRPRAAAADQPWPGVRRPRPGRWSCPVGSAPRCAELGRHRLARAGRAVGTPAEPSDRLASRRFRYRSRKRWAAWPRWDRLASAWLAWTSTQEVR